MLGKMLIHGLLAAALVGSAAAVFAQAKDNGYLSPAAVRSSPTQAPASAAPLAHAKADNGYIRPPQADFRKDKHDRERGHERKSGRRDEDRDDD